MKSVFYQVAGWTFEVALPDGVEHSQLLPSFDSFQVEILDKENLLFYLEAVSSFSGEDELGEILEENENDLGHTILRPCGKGYQVDLNYAVGGVNHTLRADAAFSQIQVCLHWEDYYVSEALNAMLRIAFAQSVLLRQGVSVHAAAVVYEGKAFLFMGKSGTGKSTHATLWQHAFSGCELLNDDNPVLRLDENKVMAYGSPWSGKTPCYRNLGYPVKGIVRLCQAPQNRFILKKEVDSFVELLPGCSVIQKDETLSGYLCDTLIEICERVTVGNLQCLPNEEAARLCAVSLGV